MRKDAARSTKHSWPRTVVKKWLNIKSRTGEQRSDCDGFSIGVQARRKSCSDGDEEIRRGLAASGWLVESYENVKPPRSGGDAPAVSSSPPPQDLRMFVGTWNVGGRAPHAGLNLRDWLMSTPSPADIYVLGFQEIVPLNAGNVLGPEDKGPADTWLSLIRQSLNPLKTRQEASLNYIDATRAISKPRVSFSELLSLEVEEEEAEWVYDRADCTNLNTSSDEDSSPDCRKTRSPSSGPGSEYHLAASKQMVGIFLCVWVRSAHMPHVRSLKVSCVGRGIMGYMGNKGSISISMTLRRTTFCFVCTHLASGEKDGDEIRRNSDVAEILKRTRFPQNQRFSKSSSCSPATISEHDEIIWLGDLNYRLTSSCSDTHELLRKNDWQALLEKDQLRIEQRAGRVFKGWEEGRIYFPPTYKYLFNSDNYVVDTAKSKEKRRNPAWCDRILWRGKGMKQMWYVRGESRFSDHRPVYSLFSVQLHQDDYVAAEVVGKDGWACKERVPATQPSVNANSPSCGKVRAEKQLLLLASRSRSCLEASRF